MATLNVSLPDAMRHWIDTQVRTGEYANASDYIRDLIRHDQRERDRVRLALVEEVGVTPTSSGTGFAQADLIANTFLPARPSM